MQRQHRFSHWLSCSLALLLVLLLGIGLVQPALAALIWQIETIDGPDDHGSHPSLALDSNGNPVMSYYEDGQDDLKIIHCGNPSCTSGNVIQMLDSSGSVGLDNSMALDSNGNPVISYWYFSGGDLKLVKCADPNCSSNLVRTVDLALNAGQYNSLELDSNGYPVISYYDGFSATLKLVHCGDASCGSGNIFQTVDNVGHVGRYTSLELDSSGRPVISYYDETNGDLKLVHCGNANCSSGNSYQTVDSTDNTGLDTALVLDSSGRPVIVYYDLTNRDLKFVHCGNANCSSGNSYQTLDSAGDVGLSSDLLLDSSGRPVITYYDFTNGDLKLVYCGDVNCSAGNSYQTVDSANDVGRFTSLVRDSYGHLVIAYHDFTTHDLKLAREFDSSPLPTVTLNQAAGQADPTLTEPVLFTVNFSEAVTGFTNADVALSGTANLTGASVTVSGGPSTYNVSVSGIASNGTVIATIPAGAATNQVGNGNTASTSSDNSVSYQGIVTSGGVLGWGETHVPAGLHDVIAIAGGHFHSLALKGDGTVVAWGDNVYGQSSVPAGLSGVIGIAAGQSHSLVVKNDGTVVAWGLNDLGQTNVPSGLNSAIAVAGGGFHSLALKSDGTVVAWGFNTPSGPNQVPAGLGNVVAIAAGTYHSLALKGDGTVVAWGDNLFGQLNVPPGLNNVVAVAAGYIHSLALKSDGTVVGWGSSSYDAHLIPDGLNNVIAIATYADHSLALKGDGTVVAWGSDFAGESNVPAGLDDVIGIAGGAGYSLAIVTAPTVAVEQAADQADPTNSDPVRFAVIFNEPVTGFTAADVILSGTTNLAGTTISLSGGPATYTISVDGLTSNGTVIATVPANVATNERGKTNFASSSADNVVTFSLDSTPPVITPNVVGTLGSNGWYISDVNVSWTVADAESVISSQSGCETQNVTSDTSSVTFTCSASSPGGSNSQSITLKRDATAPTIILVDRTAANSNGWNNGDVTVNWICSDATSGVVAASASQTVNSEGANQSATGACTDYAGNSASNTQNGINIDKTAPTISAAATTNPNAAGWYNSDVTVHFTCADNLSGVTSCPTDETLSGEGSAVASTAQTITDLAGNTSAASNVVTVKIDKTAPTISAAATTQPNANGWYNSNVTVHFTCDDALSGLVPNACPADQVLSSEGSAVASTAQTVTDLAGNTSAPSNVVTVKIDKTAPTISAAATTQPNANGWYNSNVTVHFTCADALSGVTCPTDQVLSSEGSAVASTAQTVSDLAGNTSAPSNVVTVKIDKTAPTISAAATTQPNANGWYNSNVTVHFTCDDALSGVTCPTDQVLSSEGSAVSSTAQTVTDLAGNTSAPSNVVTVKIDKTAPVVTVTGVSNNATYTLGSVPVAGCSTTDALSGVATQASLSISGGNPDGTGSFTATCSGATDNAGNSGSGSATYSVLYNWTGFFQPVDNLPTINTVNAGQAIPVKFSLGGDYGLNIFASGYPASQNITCGSSGGGSSDPIEETVTAGNSSLQYDPGTQRYIYVWKTDKAWAGTCRQLIVKLIDGSEHIALFQFNGKGRSADESEGDAAVQRTFLPLINR